MYIFRRKAQPEAVRPKETEERQTVIEKSLDGGVVVHGEIIRKEVVQPPEPKYQPIEVPAEFEKQK